VGISLVASPGSIPIGMAPPSLGGGPGAQLFQTLATDLGVSTDDLQAARKSGQSLADFAQSKGISRDKLIAAVKDSFAANAPAGAAAPSDDQLTAMANQMVDRKPGAGGGHHHHHGGGAQGVQLPDSSLLSALTGTTSTDGTSTTGTSTDQTLTQLLQNLTSSGDSSSADPSDSSLQQLLQQLTSGSSSYSSSGTTGGLSGSLGLNAFA
jgi:hypothetical protein